MKRLKRFLPLLLPVLMTACDRSSGNDDNKDLLPTSLVRNPHSATGVDTSATGGLPVLVLPDSLYDFGRMQDGEKVTHEFTFRNGGGSPLIISGAEGSCGCTVADYPRSPLAPGATGTINVVFNSAGKQGHVEKSVLVTSNSATGNRRLYIQAEVMPGTE